MIAIIIGTRPEIIKTSPIIRECKKKKEVFLSYIPDNIILTT